METSGKPSSAPASSTEPVILSLVIPTYNEAENIVVLLSGLREVLRDFDHEIIVVDDDSPDQTWRLASEFKAVPLVAGRTASVRVIHRVSERGLSSAVVAGFAAARGSFLGVMDADLSHDHRILPQLIRGMEAGADLAVGSRRVPGGGADNWPWHRRAFSSLATVFSKTLLGFTLHDPMSGFFLIRRDLFEECRIRLQPKGYKILLEMVVRSGARKIVEIPYIFKDRKQGYSKLTGSVAWNYLLQVMGLTWARFRGK